MTLSYLIYKKEQLYCRDIVALFSFKVIITFLTLIVMITIIKKKYFNTKYREKAVLMFQT